MPDPLAASIRLSTTKAALEASEFGNMPEKDEKELEIKDNDHKKSQTKREERHLVKDPNYVLKAYYDAGVQREEVPKKSSMTEDDEDNLEDSLDEDGSDTSVATTRDHPRHQKQRH
ncbi:hypothetical protein EMPS_04980 [Entomortierella parvispora]|uniref:Uncharacterized protein n=1 Tax=Entomortierella parvispora TaxID=205924 RepID=A0A9P3LW17_9FUNG|nr:hypothetical protein EMPS_04980 [Entomortierella parvispora]